MSKSLHRRDKKLKSAPGKRPYYATPPTCHQWYPQGRVLGPALFLVYINDMPGMIDVLIKPFAGDAKIYNRVQVKSSNIYLKSD